MSQLISIKKASELLRVSTKNLKCWEAVGKIRFTRTVGGRKKYYIIKKDK